MRSKAKTALPKLGAWYNRISPVIEHAIFGYAAIALTYGAVDVISTMDADISESKTFYKNIYAAAIGASVLLVDLAWEVAQGVKRKKLEPGQFLGTVTGVATSVCMNNPYLVSTAIDYFSK